MKGVAYHDGRIIRLVVPAPDCIVEERLWMHGAELVSHVNYSHLGRVRASLGVPGLLEPDPVDWLMAAPQAGEWHLPLARSA
jgi:hypothetical protein